MEINKIYFEDCLETLKNMPNNSINLIITSPPYNKNYYTKESKYKKKQICNFRKIKYDSYDDNLNPELYNDWQSKILKECCRVLTEDGSIFYNHSDILNKHCTIHPVYIYNFPIKQLLIWNRLNTPKLDNNYFYPINEYVFWIKKNTDAKTKFYRDRCNFNKSVFSLSADIKNKHPAPFPIQLPNNFILACTDENDIVYDPFMGSGTTAIASLINNRQYIGSEISKNYYISSLKRIEQHKAQLRLF
jgi:DNA modification methylase